MGGRGGRPGVREEGGEGGLVCGREGREAWCEGGRGGRPGVREGGEGGLVRDGFFTQIEGYVYHGGQPA